MAEPIAVGDQSPAEAAIRAKLDITHGVPADGVMAMRAALLAVLDEHTPVDDGSGTELVCKVCCREPECWERLPIYSPCPTVLAIATALGVLPPAPDTDSQEK